VATGVLEARQDVTLASEVGGKIKKVLKSLGDPCKKGELFLKLDTESFGLALAQAEAALSQAEVNAANAEREWRRMQKLTASQVATAQQLDNAEGALSVGKASVRQAAAAVDIARRNLRETRIKCPFTGFVAERLVENGETVAPQAPLARLVDTSSLKLVLSVTSDKLSRLEIGQRATLSDPSLPDRHYKGTVSRLGIAADAATRTFPVEVEVADAASRLRTGQVVQAELLLGVHEGVIAPPASALRTSGGEASVVTVKDGKARVTDIETGRSIDGRVIVTGGLEEGDEVVIVGGTDLKNGDAVEVTGRSKTTPKTVAEASETASP
jgi:membrane fusion protein, multidrug efflux system